MTRNHFVVIGLLAALALLLWWTTLPRAIPPNATSAASPTPTASPHTSHVAPLPEEERRKMVVEEVLASLATPITFHGRVVDQNNDPVAYANIRYGTVDKFDAEGSSYEGLADTNGDFSISGIQGAVLTVGVWKSGYYVIDGKSNGAFAYGIGPDSTRKPPPSKQHPAVFMLRKMGETEPLVHIQSRSIRVSKNGTPAEVDLMTGRRPQSSSRVVRVEAWTNNEGLNPNLNQPYDWRCRVSIPGGGLIEKTEQFDFQAPEAGYRAFDEVGFTKTAQPWKKRFDKDYFARMPDGTYARFKFGFTSGGDHFFRIESHLNPIPGHRNLEFDPMKLVKSQ